MRFLPLLGIILILLVLAGCAGQKVMSRSDGSTQTWGLIPKQKDLLLKVTINKELESRRKTSEIVFLITSKYKESLIEGLERKNLFKNISAISSNESVTSGLLLETNIEVIDAMGWGARRHGTKESSVGIFGRIVDVSEDKTLLTFSKLRQGSGGLLGMGGLLTPGEKTMLTNLMEWLANDTVEMLEKEMYK